MQQQGQGGKYADALGVTDRLWEAYCRIVFSFPKLILVVGLVVGIVLAATGLEGRNSLTDKYELYAAPSEELDIHRRYAYIWDPGPFLSVIVASQADGVENIWAPGKTQPILWVDRVLKGLSIPLVTEGDVQEIEQWAESRLQDVPLLDPESFLCPEVGRRGICVRGGEARAPMPGDPEMEWPATETAARRLSMRGLCRKPESLLATMWAREDVCFSVSPLQLGVESRRDHSAFELDGCLAPASLRQGTSLDVEPLKVICPKELIGFQKNAVRMAYFLEGENSSLLLKTADLLCPKLDHHQVSREGHAPVRVRCSHPGSLQEALNSATSLDVEMNIRLALCVCVVGTMLAMALQFIADSNLWHLIVGPLALVCVIISAAGATGFLYLCGLPHVPAAEATPFLCLGIGCDDVFLLLNALHDIAENEVPSISEDLDNVAKRRVATALRCVAPSLAASTFSSVAGLLVGAITPWRHVRIFVVTTAFGLVGVFGACVTLVPCVLLIFSPDTQHIQFEDRGGEDFADNLAADKKDDSLRLTKLISLHWVRAAVLCSWIAVITTSFISIGFLWDVGLDLREATPWGSSFRDYLELSMDHWPELGDWFSITVLPGAELGTSVISDWISSLCSGDYDYLLPSPVSGCHHQIDALIQSHDTCKSRGLCDQLFEDWMLRVDSQTLGNPYRHVIFGSPAPLAKSNVCILDDDALEEGKICHRLLWRAEIATKAGSTAENYEFYSGLRNTIPVGTEERVKITSELLPMWVGDRRLVAITLGSGSGALAAVIFTSAFLLGGSPVHIVLIGTLLLSTNVILAGVMVLLRLRLNILTMITIVMAQGFSVDYLVHMSHALGSSKLPTSESRVRSALIRVSRPIIQSFATTIAALLCLAGSPKYPLNVFCKMMTSTVIIAVIHALVLLPTLVMFLPDTWTRFQGTIKGKADEEEQHQSSVSLRNPE